jgi:hypothetical protein
MDIQGIDQVMIIPTEIDIYPWLEDALGAKAFCRAYNEWAYEYTQENPERLFFAALIPMQLHGHVLTRSHRHSPSDQAGDPRDQHVAASPMRRRDTQHQTRGRKDTVVRTQYRRAQPADMFGAMPF